MISAVAMILLSPEMYVKLYGLRAEDAPMPIDSPAIFTVPHGAETRLIWEENRRLDLATRHLSLSYACTATCLSSSHTSALFVALAFRANGIQFSK